MALWQDEQLTCKRCGSQVSECSDPQLPRYGYRTICYDTMTREAFEAKYAALHDAQPYHDGSFTSWAKERSDEHPYHYSAGVVIGVSGRDVTPWDHFATESDASPVQAVAEQTADGCE